MWFAFILVILISTLFWFFLRKPSDYPPGPWGLPIIGWPPSSLEEYFQKLIKYREEKYDAVGWRIGSYFVVAILDYDLFKEAYQHPSIAFRPLVDTVTNIRGNKTLGIIHSGGAQWTQNRRFALKHLRDLGMGKEKQLLDAHFEVDNFVNDLKNYVGKSISVPQSLVISSLNNTWQMVGSIRYNYEDKSITDFIDLVSESRVHGHRLIILDMFPWLERVLPSVFLNKFFRLETLDRLSKRFLDYFKESIYKRMKGFNKDFAEDYITAYMIEKEKRKDDPNYFMSVDDLTVCVSDLFVGATETIGHTVHWAILYLAKYQKVQEKLQEEIDRVLPDGAPFQMNDKTRLPYTEAFIHEVLRISSVTPSPPRQAVEETKLGPYTIPKGTWVFGRTIVMHFDPKYWDSPHEFRPERFLNSDGKFLAPTKGFAPFGFGKRVCIGEAISRTQLFVYITKLAQNFHFDPPPGEEVSLEEVISPFFRPPKGSPKFLISARKNN